MRDEERYSSSRPLKEFHGNEEDYPDWETDFEKWCVLRRDMGRLAPADV